MVSILYSEYDFQAADIALKVQALTNYRPIYVVPKHTISRDNTKSPLKKTDFALFISCEIHTLDPRTLNQLEQLKEGGVKITFVVSDNFKMPFHIPKCNLISCGQKRMQTLQELKNWLNSSLLPKDDFILICALTVVLCSMLSSK